MKPLDVLPPPPPNNFYRFAIGFLSIIGLSVAIIIATAYIENRSERVPDCGPVCMN